MIFVKNLTKVYKTAIKENSLIKDLFFRKYKETVALDQVSFEIGKDELIGFIGPNGAGKTTTLKILSGILYPTSGEVSVLGFNPFEKKPEFLRQISFIMGQRNQTLWELPALDSFKLTKEIYQVKDEDYQRILNKLVSLFGVEKLLSQPIKTLSLGERMKMEFINALLYQPKVIFLDEPTIGLDIFSQETIRNFIKEYQKEFKATVILTSHYLEDVKKLAKRLIIINKGKIIYDGDLKNIVNHSRTKYITVFLEKEIDQKIIEVIGQPLVFQYPKIVWRIAKDDLPEKISQINHLIPYSDINIEEEKIEEIIKKLFKKD